MSKTKASLDEKVEDIGEEKKAQALLENQISRQGGEECQDSRLGQVFKTVKAIKGQTKT